MRLYKRSYYNIQVRVPSGWRVFNSRTGAIVDLDRSDPLFQGFRKMWAKKRFALGEHEWLPALERLGMVIPCDVDEVEEYHSRFAARQSTDDILSLVVMPTESCNFRCVYCYEDFKRGKMARNTLNSLNLFIRQRCRNLRALRIEWFGGEPFLAVDLIDSISKCAIETTRAVGIPYEAAATTNGYFLTREIFHRAVDEWNITRFQITVDGPQIFHDQRRPLLTGAGTFRRIWKNITYIASSDYPHIKCTIRMNVDRGNFHTISEFMRMLKGIVRGDLRFSFFARRIWGKSKFGVLGPDQEERLLQLVGNQCNTLKLRWNDPEIYLNPALAGCYAKRPNSLVVGSDGTLYKCTADFEMAQNRVGRLRDDGSLEIDQEKFDLWCPTDLEDYPYCQRCVFLPVCDVGECPKRRILRRVRNAPPDRHTLCKGIRQKIKAILRVYQLENHQQRIEHVIGNSPPYEQDGSTAS